MNTCLGSSQTVAASTKHQIFSGLARPKVSFFGKLEQERFPNIDTKSLPWFPGDPGIQILTKKIRCLATKQAPLTFRITYFSSSAAIRISPFRIECQFFCSISRYVLCSYATETGLTFFALFTLLNWPKIIDEREAGVGPFLNYYQLLTGLQKFAPK